MKVRYDRKTDILSVPSSEGQVLRYNIPQRPTNDLVFSPITCDNRNILPEKCSGFSGSQSRDSSVRGNMAVFQSLASTLRALALGDRVKVTLRPETGQLFPIDGRILLKDESGNLSLQSETGVVQIRAADVLSITRLER
jgi:hypothetical protein